MNQSSNNDLIINFTPTGMIPTKEINPYTPISPNEIIEEVHRAYDIGITILHLHARDPESGKPTYKKEIYGELIRGIRKYCPRLIICVSLSGRNFPEFEKRSEPLQLEGELKPDMGSLTLSSLNFPISASINSPDILQALTEEMKKRNIKPELEAFDSGMINYSKYLIKKGLVTPPYYYNIILGNISNTQANLLYSGAAINDLPDNSYWSFGGIGSDQLVMNTFAIATLGGIRIGLEDNIWFDKKRTKPAKNTDLIERILLLAEIFERKVMTPEKCRSLLNLKSGDGEYGTN
ncbi:3-keto-5-aminohexanoate cleavage protein [Bacteroidota bacterium]